MVDQKLLPRLLDMHTAAGMMESPLRDWTMAENDTDPDMQKLLPVWSAFLASKAEFEAMLAELYVKRADELTVTRS